MSSCYRWISVKRVRTQSSLHINIGTHSPHLALIYNSHVITLFHKMFIVICQTFILKEKLVFFFKRGYFIFTFGNIKYFISGWYGCYWCYFKWVIRLMDFWNVDKNLKSVFSGNKMFSGLMCICWGTQKEYQDLILLTTVKQFSLDELKLWSHNL